MAFKQVMERLLREQAPELKWPPWPMVEFLRYIGTACVQQNISMVELGRRQGWSDDITLTILQGKMTPTKVQLEAISQEMDIPLHTLTGLLEK
jgi:hypothetical protein